ncbi:hypothetical protein LSH36_79g09043 [Paralvinella palmiformis]|uniref:PX domain-containing protein n=1 Tax=Paralvinella palmiformis TaxID=53620 RepID=A0AAD9K243_9ANNE|nr:hypothetical protein LSH36_79g09043 [Paralvinella palmiformis]
MTTPLFNMADDKLESSREPPPLFDDDDDDDDMDDKEQENEDIFASVSEPSTKSPVKDEDDSTDDLFAEAQTEVPLDSPEKATAVSPSSKEIMEPVPDQPNLEAAAVSTNSSPATMNAETTSTITAPIVSSTVNEPKRLPESRSQEEIDEEEGGDQFNMEVTVTEPKKVGDGMNAYMAYRVNTKTTLPEFNKPEMSVYRRFSDFLGLHEKLVEHHQHDGVFIPPPPSKSVLGMTKIKMSKEEAVSIDFVEKRRAALERFLNRTAKHPILRKDTYFIEFLTQDGDLPKATSTSALSGAGVMRLFNRVGDSFGKMTFKMDEADQWFEEKQQQVEMMESQLRKLHASIDALVQHRKELAQNTGAFAKSAAMLGNA